MDKINHMDILKRGVSEWNKWRVERTNIAPDLRAADLKDASLAGADLRAVNLRGADLKGANLRGANLRAADLRAADMKGAILWSASLTGADLRAADLTGADLRGVNFRAANLMNAILVGVATNDSTDFRHATVTGARLWEDGEPVAEDWQAELTKTVDRHTLKALVKVEFHDYIAAADFSAIAAMLDEAVFEYEESFIASLGEVVGESLVDACMYRLRKERKQIVRLTRFETGSLDMEAVLVPMGFQILGRTVFKDIEDIWKRITTGGAIKKVLIQRMDLAAGELQKILRKTMEQWENLRRFELTVKTAGDTPKAPDFVIALTLRKHPEQPAGPSADRPTPAGGAVVK